MESKGNSCTLRIWGNGYPDSVIGELGFSWSVEGMTGKQSAYRLSMVDAENNPVWNTGWTASDCSAGIEYSGPDLKSNAQYTASVALRSNEGHIIHSAPVSFSTGFMSDDEWKGDWLLSPFALGTAGSPVFRRDLRIDRPIKRARMFICGLGYCQLHVNGHRVGDRYMDPAWTDYTKRVNYVAYDITDLLCTGDNALGVCLAAGWYSNSNAMPRPTFAAQLMIDYEDGSSDCIPTLADGSWKALKDSWIMSCSIYIGEVVDARRMIDGWDTPDYRMEDGWLAALEGEPPLGKLTPMRVEPIRCVKKMPAGSISQPQPGIFVVDFKQNMAGIIELKLHNLEPGTKVMIRYSELIDDAGMLNTENLRKAQAHDVYISRGGEECYRSLFTYHGFRYAEVTGLNCELKPEDITALVMRSDVAVRSEFETSCSLINDIQRICAWTENNNLHSIPTDCPQRDERLGWLNDLTVRIEESMFNFELDNFFRKYLEDIMDTQGKKTGAIADTAPYHIFGGRPADAVCSSYLILPWMIYKHYGDRAVLARAWPGLKAWTDYLARQRIDGIVFYSYYGDWAAPVGGSVRFSIGSGAVSAITPGMLMSTGFLYMNCKLLAQIAEILDLPDESAYYTALAEETKESLNRTFLNREDGYYAANSQASNAFMLYLDVVPEEYRKKVLEHLVADILEHDIHTTTGNLCSRYILDVLAENSKIDLAYGIVNQTTYPSWGYMLSKGATTTWERWEYVDRGELIGMASHDHPMYATVSGWFYKYLAGFRPIGAGFDRFELRPYFPEKLDHVRSKVHTCKGSAEISWKKTGSRIYAEVKVPFNSECLFTLSTDGDRPVDVDGAYFGTVHEITLQPGIHIVAFEL